VNASHCITLRRVVVAVGDGLSMRGMGGMNVWADTNAATQKPDKALGKRDAIGLVMALRSCSAAGSVTWL
jgi:hypothetical protein